MICVTPKNQKSGIVLMLSKMGYVLIVNAILDLITVG